LPKTKQFEYMDINDFIFGMKEVKYMDMYEISNHYFNHIMLVYKYLEEGKVVVTEVPEEDCTFHIEKITSEKFIISKNGFADFSSEYNAIELVNWLFAKAPWFSMVGYNNN
jgi:hypothetical protein